MQTEAKMKKIGRSPYFQRIDSLSQLGSSSGPQSTEDDLSDYFLSSPMMAFYQFYSRCIAKKLIHYTICLEQDK